MSEQEQQKLLEASSKLQDISNQLRDVFHQLDKLKRFERYDVLNCHKHSIANSMTEMAYVSRWLVDLAGFEIQWY